MPIFDAKPGGIRLFQVEQSNKVIEWMKEKDFSVIDVNTTAAFPVYRSVSRSFCRTAISTRS